MARPRPRVIKAGSFEKYIAQWPEQTQIRLLEMREAIREVAADAVETLSYFDMPGYSYKGYDYNGMFAWFSAKGDFVRLHVRPQALIRHQQDITNYSQTKAIVSFPVEKKVPKTLVQKLVKASVMDMKRAAKRK